MNRSEACDRTSRPEFGRVRSCSVSFASGAEIQGWERSQRSREAFIQLSLAERLWCVQDTPRPSLSVDGRRNSRSSRYWSEWLSSVMRWMSPIYKEGFRDTCAARTVSASPYESRSSFPAYALLSPLFRTWHARCIGQTHPVWRQPSRGRATGSDCRRCQPGS
jgi:hypothetical protein